MEAKVIAECGYEQAMLGISLSWASNPDRAKEIAPRLAHKQGGHNKFLESIMVWVDIDAPRYWWSEFDTYRVGVSKQSESTMHTITKKMLTEKDFEGNVSYDHIYHINNMIRSYREEEDAEKKKALFLEIKQNLPEGFLQRRIVCMSYKTLQNMYWQRKNHRLPEWEKFFRLIFNGLEHKEFIVEEK